MARLLIAAAVVVGAVLVAVVVRRRRPDAPTQGGRQGPAVPAQLDRRDFARPDAPWLVAVFTSATCHTCADVGAKVAVLESAEVAVAEVEYDRNRAVHQRYGIDAVPLVVVADAEGVVRRSFLGPVTATDLWAAVAWTRDGAPPDAGSCERR